MGKVRERQIILKTDQCNVLLELGPGGKSKRDQSDGTTTEPFSKAMFAKLKYAMSAGCYPRSGRAAPGTASGPALFSDRGVTV
jgi:hypothetical protein